MWEKKELPSQQQPQKAEKSPMPIQIGVFKDVIANSDGDTFLSKNEEQIIAYFDKELYDKVPPRIQEEWVRQIVFALKKYRIEKQEVQAICEIALRRSRSDKKDTGSEKANDFTDLILNRKYCKTLADTDYAPKELSDIRLIAGYFRHIYNDPKQRAEYLNYLKGNPAEKEKFLKFWERDSAVKYYLESNRENSIVGNIGSFAQELRSRESRTVLSVTNAIRYFETPEGSSSLVKAFVNDPQKASEELVKELANNPILMMRAIWGMGNNWALRKTLLEQTQWNKAIEDIDSAFISAVKHYKILVNKKSVAELDAPGTARIIAKEIAKQNIFRADNANAHHLNYAMQLIAQDYGGFGTEADVNKFLRDTGLEKMGTSFADDTELQAMIIVSARNAKNMGALRSRVLGIHRGKSIENILSKWSLAEVKKVLDSNDSSIIDEAVAKAKAYTESPYDLEKGMIVVSSKHGFTFKKEADYKAEVKGQGFREVNLVNLRNYIKYLQAKKQDLKANLMELFGVPNSPVDGMEKIVSLGSQLNVDVIGGKPGAAPADRREIQQLFVSHILPEFRPIVDMLKMRAMGAQTLNIIESTTGRKLSKQDREEIMKTLETKDGQQKSSIEYIRVIHEFVKSPAHRADIIKAIMAEDTKFQTTAAGAETKRAGRDLSPTLVAVLGKNGLHVKWNSFVIRTEAEAIAVEAMSLNPAKYGLSKEDAYSLKKIIDKDQLVLRIRENATLAKNASALANADGTQKATDLATKANEATRAAMRKEWAEIRKQEITRGKTKEEIENDPKITKQLELLEQERKSAQAVLNEISRETRGALKIASTEEIDAFIIHSVPGIGTELDLVSPRQEIKAEASGKGTKSKDSPTEWKRWSTGDRSNANSSNASGPEYANLDQTSLEARKTVALDKDGHFTLRKWGKSGGLILEIDGSKIRFPKTEANLALSFIETAQKIGEIDLIRNIQPMLRSMKEQGVFSTLNNGMSNKEELEMMKYLVKLYGIENVNMQEMDPTTLAKSIQLNVQKKGNSFDSKGKSLGLLDDGGRLRITGLDARVRQLANGGEKTVSQLA